MKIWEPLPGFVSTCRENLYQHVERICISMSREFVSACRENLRRIHNPVKHRRCSFLRKKLKRACDFYGFHQNSGFPDKKL